MIREINIIDKITNVKKFIGNPLNSWLRLVFGCIILITSGVGCEFFDVIPPRIDISRPEDQGSVIYRDEIAGEVKETNLDRVEIFVNYARISVQMENNFYCIAYFPEEKNIIRIKAYDKSGNWSEVTLEVYREMPSY